LPEARIATNVPVFRNDLLTIIFGIAPTTGIRQKVLRNLCLAALLAGIGKNLPGNAAQSARFQKDKGGAGEMPASPLT